MKTPNVFSLRSFLATSAAILLHTVITAPAHGDAPTPVDTQIDACLLYTSDAADE